MLIQECQEVPRILQCRVLSPFDLDRNQPVGSLDNEVNLGPILGPLVAQCALAKVLEAFP